VLLQLDVPFRDAASTDLVWSLLPGAAAPAALAALDVTIGAVALRLHVLGASHAVEVRAGDRRLTEVVACDALGGRALAGAPPVVDHDGLRYRFEAEVEERGAAGVAALGEQLRAACAERSDALLAAFPGAPGALTALCPTRLDDPSSATAGWETWHLYPERGEVVRTRSSVSIAAPADARILRPELVR
jgi:hypothetical protein